MKLIIEKIPIILEPTLDRQLSSRPMFLPCLKLALID